MGLPIGHLRPTNRPSGATRSAGFAVAVLAALAVQTGLASGQASIAAPPPDAYAPRSQSAERAPYPGADVRQDRIEELEAQVQAATAENERLQFQLMQAERELQRLRNMIGELANTNQTLQQPAPPPADAPGQSAAQRAHTGVLGTLPASQVPQAPPPPPPPPAPPRDPAEDYRAAQALLLNNRIADAELAFQDFLRVHTDAREAPDARFWFAYTLLARNNFAAARDTYVEFLQRYPNHPRAGEAQIRLGMALAGLGETRMACAAFADLPRNSARAVRDLAAREARAANCPS